MPGTPFSTAVTLDELWKNILQDLGQNPQTASPGPIEMKNILRLLDFGLFGTSLANFGDGSDGTVTFNGTSTVLGLTPSSNVYTLTRDIWLSNGSTINSGVTIATAGFRIFCQGNLVNNGTIQNNGNAAVTTTGGAGFAQAATAPSASGTGGNGGTGASNAGNGEINSLGGSGGAGGNNTSVPNAGGAGGAATAPAATFQLPRSLPLAIEGRLFNNGTATAYYAGGCGGGSGGGDGTNNAGSGGGGGGNVIVVAVTITGTGTISANGGAGSAASATGNSGGGAGGGGGVVIVVSRSVIPPSVSGTTAAIPGQTVTAAGGAGATGNGTGAAGAAGSAGTVILLPA